MTFDIPGREAFIIKRSGGRCEHTSGEVRCDEQSGELAKSYKGRVTLHMLKKRSTSSDVDPDDWVVFCWRHARNFELRRKPPKPRAPKKDPDQLDSFGEKGKKK